MEKDVDEVGKIARNVKAKIEGISKDVLLFIYIYIYIYAHTHINI